MNLKIYQVDSFTTQAFSGNPAGVCILDSPIDDFLMQQIAMEMNLAETAFVVREDAGFRLRWFTPTVEVDLCGHATLATAHMLWETGALPNGETAKFNTRSGLLEATRTGAEILLDFPSQPPVEAQSEEGLLDALGLKKEQVAFEGFNQADFLIEVQSEADLRGIDPDFGSLKQVDCRGVIVTCRSEDSKFHFLSRFFAPAVGVDEDPVTGSAHCCLTPYWANKLGLSTMKAFQASSRGGELTVTLKQDRVELQGSAVTVIQGELTV